MMVIVRHKDKAMLLQGKRILVTGASRGLGRAMAIHFASEGADVAFNYAHDGEGARDTLQALHAYGVRSLSGRASVLDVKACDTFVQEIEAAWGGIDVLVNNAGLTQPLPIALMEEDDWDQVMDVNVKGTFLVVRAVLRGMIRRRQGCVLNIGSLAGMRMIEAPVHYCASKAAIKGLTEALAKEVARYNIRVNCLAPGLLNDGMSQNIPDYRLHEFLKYVALHRVGTTAEVARFAAFMVSDKNSYMNGATVVMDGGF